LGNPTLKLDDFTAEELLEIFASTWFGMDIDFRGFEILDDEKRAADSSRFAKLNGIRYSVLHKIVNRFQGTDKHDDMQAILDSAGEIMVIARGGVE
jgi:hypothetical protein